MSTLDFKVIDLDFPVGAKNKTATLITGDKEAFLIDAGFTRADGHRLVAEILDSGKELTKVFVSHADPDFYWGTEVVADACTHRGASLAEGECDGPEAICPWHGARFDLTTGAAKTPPAPRGVQAYKVQVVGEEIQLDM